MDNEYICAIWQWDSAGERGEFRVSWDEGRERKRKRGENGEKRSFYGERWVEIGEKWAVWGENGLIEVVSGWVEVEID